MSSGEDVYEVAVIGGGIAGAASALRAVQYELPTLWLLGDRKTAKASRSKYVMNIDNMIGVHPDIILSRLPDEVVAELPHQHISTQDIIENTRHRIRTEHAERLTEVETRANEVKQLDDGTFKIVTDDRVWHAKAVVLATGIMDRQPSIAKQRGDKVMDRPTWLYPFANRESVLYCIRCEGHLTRDEKVAVIGHSEVAAQVAIMLAERYHSAGWLLSNGEPFTFEERTGRLLEHYGVSISASRIVDLEGEDGPSRYHLRAIHLEDGTRAPVRFGLVSMGVFRVYNELARHVGAELLGDGPEEERYVKIDNRGETSVRGFFAVGDLARREDEPVMMQVYTAQEYAVRAVDTVDRRRRSASRKRILGEA